MLPRVQRVPPVARMLVGAASLAIAVLLLTPGGRGAGMVDAQGESETIALVAGCNPVAVTYPDSTPIGTIADAVSPPGILISIWEFDMGLWLGYSPQFPEVSDLTEKDFLDVAFLCVSVSGTFTRPVV
jgi:hypothetical protein